MPQRARSKEIRDTDLYLDDGSIILSARNTNEELVMFRVHKSVLIKHSSVFNDMFSFPPPAAMETYDDLPLVHLHDDAEELKDFISALYDPCVLPFEVLDLETPSKIKGPLKLATKYQVEPLRQRIIKHLENDWPATLAEWDKICSLHTERFGQSDLSLDASTIVSLAITYDIPSIMPTSLYYLSHQRFRFPYSDEHALRALRGRVLMVGATCDAADTCLRFRDWECENVNCQRAAMFHWISVVEDFTVEGDPLGALQRKIKQLQWRSPPIIAGCNLPIGSADWWGEDHIREEGGDPRPCDAMFCRFTMADRMAELREVLFSQMQTLFK